MEKLKKIHFLFIALLFLVFALVYYLSNQDENIPQTFDKELYVKTEQRIVNGNSLAPIITDGSTVDIILDYYEHNDIERGDIVLYNFTGTENPIIKIIKGIPGDKFELKESSSGWNILVNNQVLKNSEGLPYTLYGNKYKMLSLYEKSYNNKIPEDAYLLLGNLVSGSTDSTRFGLVDKSDILGKVIFK